MKTNHPSTSGVHRWSPDVDGSMMPDQEHGDWIMWEDYQKLQENDGKTLDALIDNMAKLRNQNIELKFYLAETLTRRDELIDKNKVLEGENEKFREGYHKYQQTNINL